MRGGLGKHGVAFRSARDDITDWLGAAGWQASTHAGVDPAIGHGRSVAPVPAAWLAAATLRIVAAGNHSRGPSGRSQ